MHPLTHDLIDFLLTHRARAAIQDLASVDLGEARTLRTLTELRRSFTPSQSAALLDQARLRCRAVTKFEQPERFLFTDEALQQASGRAVARYRMEAFAQYRTVADLGCGLGADTIALAEQGCGVQAIERDPIRARLAEVNIAAAGFADRVRVVCADWTDLHLEVDAAFVDPSRRRGGRRLFGVDQMEPPISAVLGLVDRVPNVAVKVAPGIEHSRIPETAEVEFISERGQLKEALLRFGGLRPGTERTATLLPGREQLTGDKPDPYIAISAPMRSLYEPDPAVIRSGLVRALGALIGANQIDPRIAYLTSDRLLATPFARTWEVLRHGRFGLKTLNQWLRELGAGEVVVKKRGSAIEPDPFRRRLATVKGGRALTVFLTRVSDRPWMIIGQEVRAA